ncbi:MAG: CapA family protein [Actinobacteria bacterium]|nr:CapA family protein [Actinomycetota bacterium]
MGFRVWCCAAGALLAVVACDGTPRTGAAPARPFTLTVLDERAAAIPGARLTLVGQASPLAVDGSRDLSLTQPTAGVLRADGFLDEPVVLDPAEGDVRVTLLARTGPNGATRRVLQFGGDVMMGRRYQAPETDIGTAVVDDAATARGLVADVAPLMAAADLSTVNLESVVGDLPPLDAYPAKRFLIQSPPEVIDALQQMGVDAVTLGNNHAYDWQDDGVASTIAHLDRAGVEWAGAGADAAQAQAGRMLEVNGLQVGLVSATTVNGDFVNDSLPPADEPVPEDLPAQDAWQYETRAFRYGGLGDPAHVAPGLRRAHEIWTLYESLEPTLDAASSAGLWREITRVYPELQDWVARRGHGGAALFQRFEVARQVQQLRDQGAGLVVVQIHGGFQFSEAPSEFLRRAAHDAIDAGADLVVGHHPHVLQGFEWYRGHLIAYSLGNFLFDQDFLSTFPSVILRTVFEGDELLEARVVPLMLDRYRPVPVTGPVAERVVKLMNASSLLAASSDRLTPEVAAAVLDPDLAPTAVVRPDGGGYSVDQAGEPVSNTYSVSPDRPVHLPECAVVRTVSEPPDGASIGLDLLGWGSLDDGTADRVNDGGMHWTGDGTTRYSDDRGTYLHLESIPSKGSRARQVARSEVLEHRWFDSDGAPLDGEPTYTVQLDIRPDGRKPRLELVLYDVNDTDPTVEPSSTELHQADVDLPITPSGEWTTVTVDVSDLINATYDGVRPEAAMLYVVAPAGDNRLDIDDVHLFEWRHLTDLPTDVWMPADALAADVEVDVPLQVHGCSPSR